MSTYELSRPCVSRYKSSDSGIDLARGMTAVSGWMGECLQDYYVMLLLGFKVAPLTPPVLRGIRNYCLTISIV